MRKEQKRLTLQNPLTQKYVKEVPRMIPSYNLLHDNIKNVAWLRKTCDALASTAMITAVGALLENKIYRDRVSVQVDDDYEMVTKTEALKLRKTSILVADQLLTRQSTVEELQKEKVALQKDLNLSIKRYTSMRLAPVDVLFIAAYR